MMKRAKKQEAHLCAKSPGSSPMSLASINNPTGASVPRPRMQAFHSFGPRDDDITMHPPRPELQEESFCSNFVCCGQYLADLHALLQHYEEVHVKIEEDVDVDVVGEDATPPPLGALYTSSTSSFGSPAAANMLLDVAQHGYGRLGGVSAFDTTVLRPVSPAQYRSQGLYGGGGYGQGFYEQQAVLVPSGGMDKRTRAAPSVMAQAAASNALRASLPVNGSENHVKFIYSVLNSTLDPVRKGEDGGGGRRDVIRSVKHPARNLASIQRQPVDKTAERPYVCNVSGCGKSYKNPNGLKYHAIHGHDASGEIVDKPHRCSVQGCGKRYKNANGLKYHMAHSHHIEARSTASAHTGKSASPMSVKSLVDADDRRRYAVSAALH